MIRQSRLMLTEFFKKVSAAQQNGTISLELADKFYVRFFIIFYPKARCNKSDKTKKTIEVRQNTRPTPTFRHDSLSELPTRKFIYDLRNFSNSTSSFQIQDR